MYKKSSISKNQNFVPMNLFWVFIFVLLKAAESQHVFNPDEPGTEDAVTSFKPSLAVVVGILCVMFSLTCILLLYAKFCHRGASISYRRSQLHNPALIRSTTTNSRFSGIDKTVIESLPFFRFSSLKGSKQGLECAVCLSKFEDIEILRLLPKCKHAFHINCIDQWLEKHSSCPLCRNKVDIHDPSIFTYSNSMRLMFSQSEMRQDSNVEIFVEREEDVQGSSRLNSFRKNVDVDEGDGEVLIGEEEEGRVLHRLNHKIVVSDVMLKNRWSSASSSDLIFLKSEMLNDVSSNRFSVSKRDKSGEERRSVSEITAVSRFKEGGDESKRRMWLPIARKTVEWFADKEKRGQSSNGDTGGSALDV